MSLDTYANLKTAVGTWTHRDDLSAVIDDIIDLAEAEMFNNDSQPLRVEQMETRATASASTTSRYIALPTRYLDMRRLQISSTDPRTDIRHASPESLKVLDGTGRPRYFTTTSQIEFDIKPDTAYTLEMLYYKKPTALDSTNTTNAILTNYPNVYLYGCQWATLVFGSEDERAAAMYNRFIGSIRGANKRSRKARYSGVPVMRPEGATP